MRIHDGRIRRVLMTADTIGGVWTYALDLARGLSAGGVEVILATMGAPLTAAQAAEAHDVPGLTVRASTYRLEWMEDPWDDVSRAGAWLLELESDMQPDVVHLNGYAHGSLPWRRPTLVVGHSCVLSWWRAVHGAEAPARWDRYRGVVTRGLAAADLVVAPSAFMMAELQRWYGPLVRTRVIPNGRDPKMYAPATKEPFILSVGRLWDEAKNLTVLDRVAPQLPWPVYVAGEEKHPHGGQVSMRRVLPLGRLPLRELAPWFARAAIYALPARYEPFGLSAVEAGLCGCALVLGDIPSLREVWGDAAVFVPPEDTAALASALQGLTRDDDQRRALGSKAIEHARRLTSRQMAAGYLTTYQELLRRQTERRRGTGQRPSLLGG